MDLEFKLWFCGYNNLMFWFNLKTFVACLPYQFVSNYGELVSLQKNFPNVIIHYIVEFYARSSFHAIHFVMTDHMSPIDEIIIFENVVSFYVRENF